MPESFLDWDSGIKKICTKISSLAEQKNPIIIGITGPSCAGKTTISKIVSQKVNGSLLSMDDYYKERQKNEYHKKLQKTPVKNFDSPDSVDIKLFAEHLYLLLNKKTIKKPVYDFTISNRTGFESFSSNNIIITEGLFVFNPEISKFLDLKIFLDAPRNLRLERKIERDVFERNRTKEYALNQFLDNTEPFEKKHIYPFKKHADILIQNIKNSVLTDNNNI